MIAVAPNATTDLLRRIDETVADDWILCGGCRTLLHRAKLRRSFGICVQCGHHMQLTASDRIDLLVDSGTFTEHDADIVPGDPLHFVDSVPYPQRLASAAVRSGRPEAALAGSARIGGHPVEICVLDFGFMGGSMGSVVGERVTRAAERATERRVPLITCSTSGGARMQEGVIALLQMAKTVAALNRTTAAGVPHVSILADPVYGGVMASFASIADVVLAEPRARAGFAGPRVIEQTIRQQLPAGFQTAEFLLEHGHIDAVVPRDRLRATVGSVIAFHAAVIPRVETAAPIARPAQALPGPAAGGPDAWDVVGLARHPDRPLVTEYVDLVFDSFVELRGDRWCGDDPSVLGGLAVLAGLPVVVIGHRKGRGTVEAVARNFGMPHPAGYRKARRLMEYAERFGLALVTLVDTPGAYPGLRAEEQNQSLAIADCIRVLADLPVPVVAAVTGEGGSGGALALAVCDRLLMFEHATYSVISPEGCASILFGDARRAADAARSLRLTARELVTMGVADAVVPEPPGGAHHDRPAAAAALRAALLAQLTELRCRAPESLVAERWRRLRGVGAPMVRMATGVRTQSGTIAS